MSLDGWNIVLLKDSLSAQILAKDCRKNKYNGEHPILPCKYWEISSAPNFLRIWEIGEKDRESRPLLPEVEVHIPCSDIALIYLIPEEHVVSTFGFTPK